MKYGAPDGHGRHGILGVDDDGLLVCHECGRPWKHLGTHVRQAHGIMPADYRAAHGLGASTRLVAAVVSEQMRRAWQAHETEHLATLEATRDIDRARQASPVGHRGGRREAARPEVRAGYQARARARRGRELTDHETATLGDGLDLQAWADTARALLRDPTLSARSLAQACDIAPATVHQRLRRYPPHS